MSESGLTESEAYILVRRSDLEELARQVERLIQICRENNDAQTLWNCEKGREMVN